MSNPPERADESRRLLREAFAFAFGAYMEQESTKGDSWRDPEYTLGHAYAHLAHEIKEVQANLKRQDSRTLLIHNLSDMVTLSTMLLAKVLVEGGEIR